MANRRPITSHPLFAPFLALWFAALLGLGVAVLPVPLLGRALDILGLEVTGGGRLIASIGAGLLGAILGRGLGRLLARRGRPDPRPTYAEAEWPAEAPAVEEPARRPLRVREELIEHGEDDLARREPAGAGLAQRRAEAEEGFMILAPQPIHPARPAPDMEGLLAQFDNALAAFRSGDDDRPGLGDDPVRAFVARQTGTPSPSPSPLGGPMPDHQAELRAALDKLARARDGGD